MARKSVKKELQKRHSINVRLSEIENQLVKKYMRSKSAKKLAPLIRKVFMEEVIKEMEVQK